MDALITSTGTKIGDVVSVANKVPADELGERLACESGRLQLAIETGSAYEQAVASVLVAVLTNRYLTETLGVSMDVAELIPC